MGEHRVRTHWPKPVSTETYIPLYIQKKIAMYCHYIFYRNDFIKSEDIV